ncbi:MAG: CBS domain-containing protein [Ramlibacter sp.]|nr:CBS domain-containing protein [Ramlibacter sp.]
MNISRKLISAVMTRKVCQVGVEQTAKEALALMQSHSVSSVLVIEDELILGIITERDIVRALHDNGKLKSLSCVDLMHAPVITVGAKTRCLDAYHLMASRGIRHLAVTDGQGHVLGIASEGDVMRHFGIEYYTNFKEVGGVMSTDFCMLPPSATVAEALAQMLEKNQSCVIVTDSLGHPAGVLTERDVVRLSNEEAHPERLTLKKVMKGPVITVRPRKRLHAAVKSMEEAHIRRLVVVNDVGAVCGLLTHHEVARGLESEYVTYLKEMVELQARTLLQAAEVIDEKLLLANILRSVTGTAVLASDLDYRISYATPSVDRVLGLRMEDIGGADLRDTLKRAGWQAASTSLKEETVSKGTRHYLVDTTSGKTDFQVSVLVDAQNDPKGYLVLAQRA